MLTRRQLVVILVSVILILVIGISFWFWWNRGTVNIQINLQSLITVDNDERINLQQGSNEIILDTGVHSLRFEKDKYQSIEKVIEIAARGKYQFDINMIFDPVITQVQVSELFQIPEKNKAGAYSDNQMKLFWEESKTTPEPKELKNLPFNLTSGMFESNKKWAIFTNKVGDIDRLWLYDIEKNKSLPLQTSVKTISFDKAGEKIVYFKKENSGGSFEVGNLTDMDSKKLSMIVKTEEISQLKTFDENQAIFILKQNQNGLADLYFLDITNGRKSKILESRDIFDWTRVPDNNSLILAERNKSKFRPDLSLFNLDDNTEIRLDITAPLNHIVFDSLNNRLLVLEDKEDKNEFIFYDMETKEKTRLKEFPAFDPDFLIISDNGKLVYFIDNGVQYEMRVDE